MHIYKPVLLGLLPILALASLGLRRGYAARLDTEGKLPHQARTRGANHAGEVRG